MDWFFWWKLCMLIETYFLPFWIIYWRLERIQKGVWARLCLHFINQWVEVLGRPLNIFINCYPSLPPFLPLAPVLCISLFGTLTLTWCGLKSPQTIICRCQISLLTFKTSLMKKMWMLPSEHPRQLFFFHHLNYQHCVEAYVWNSTLVDI